LTHVNSAYTGF